MPKLQTFEPRGNIGGVPDFVVQTGQSGTDLAEAATALGSRLKGMADRAAAREGEAAGLDAGRAAGEKFVNGPAGAEATPLQLRNNGTIRGEAFDGAAVNAYGWRMSAGLGRELGEAYEAHKDSPGGYEAAIAGIRDKFVTDDELLQGGPLGELFERLFVEKTTVARLSVQANHERKLAAERRAATVDGIDALYGQLERDAYNAGANPAAIAAVNAQVLRVHAQIDNAVAANILTPAEGNAAKEKLRATVFGAQTEGVFDQLPTVDQQQDFALQIMTDYASGTGPFADISLDQASNLSNTLYARAAADLARKTSAEAAEAERLKLLISDDVASMAATGQGLAATVPGFTPRRVAELLGGDAVADWQRTRMEAQTVYSSTVGMEASTAAQIDARVQALKPAPGAQDFDLLNRVHAAAAKRAQEVLKDRETDPLLQAHFSGLVALQPIDPTTPASLKASLTQRAAAAQVVVGQYGTPMTIFRPDERATLANALLEHPDQLTDFAATLKDALGPLASTALEELAEEGPVVAHAAGIGLATGVNAVAADISQVVSGRRTGAYKVKMPSEGRLAAEISGMLDAAFLGNDDALGAVTGVAALLWEKDVNQLGLDTADLARPGTAAHDALKRAVNRALGGRQINGAQWGGLGTLNGHTAALPSFLPAPRAQQVLDSLNDDVLTYLPPIASALGVPVSAEQIRRANLIAVGDGQYRVSLGDPQGFEPQYVATPSGDYWTLDFRELEAAQTNLGITGPPSLFSAIFPPTVPVFDDRIRDFAAAEGFKDPVGALAIARQLQAKKRSMYEIRAQLRKQFGS